MKENLRLCIDCKYKKGRDCHHDKAKWEYTNPVNGDYSVSWTSCSLMRTEPFSCLRQGYLWEPKGPSRFSKVIQWFKEL